MNYQPVDFSGMVPELKVPDYVKPFEEDQRNIEKIQRQQFSELEQSFKMEDLQAKRNMEALSSLSKTLAETTQKVYQQEKINQYDETFYSFLKKGREEGLTDLQVEQDRQEQDLKAESDSAVNAGAREVRANPEKASAFQEAQQLTGHRQAAAFNALAAANVKQYDGFLTKVIAARNPQTPQEYQAAQAEAEVLFGRQTGLNQANQGFLAKHVLPTMYRAEDASEERWTKQYNIRKGDEARVQATSDFINGGSIQNFISQTTATISKNGTTLFSNTQALEAIDTMAGDGTLSMGRIVSLGDEINPQTKKPWSESPRYRTWIDAAREYKTNQRKAVRAEEKLDMIDRINALGPDVSREQLNQLAEEAIADGVSIDIVRDAVTAGRSDSAEALRNREESDRINAQNPDDLTPDGKIKDEVAAGFSLETRRQYSDQLSPNMLGITQQEEILSSDEGKALVKDIPNLISTIDPDLKLENKLTGQKGPANQNAFELSVKNWVVNRASQLMLGGEDGTSSMTMAQAIATAKREWQEQNKKLYNENPENFIKNGQFVVGMGSGDLTAKKAADAALAVQGATVNTMHEALTDADLNSTPDNYSERVKILARKFGMRPEQIVRIARKTKGLEQPPTTPAEASVAAIPPADQARLNSVTDPSVQSALRAQIRAGQALRGTPEARAVAVGRQLLALGYKGIWQNKYFNYENGYTPAGGQRVMQRPYASAHNNNQALDIGIAANGKEKLDALAYYLNMNKKKFGIRLVLWQTEGHYDHVHVDFE